MNVRQTTFAVAIAFVLAQTAFAQTIEQRVSDLEQITTNTESKADAALGQAINLRNRASAIESDVADIETSVAEAEAQRNAATTQVDSHGARVSANEVGISANYAAIEDLKSSSGFGTSALDRRVTTVQSELDAYRAATDERLSALSTDLRRSQKAYRAGIAGVAAMSNIPTLARGAGFAVDAGVGHFDGETSIAVGATLALDNNVSMKTSISTSGDHPAYGAGFIIGW